MSLPETIRVKLSSEAAESISLTPVVVREIPVRELVEHMLGVTGKDETRVHELLLRGTLVSGASRFRWTGWEADLDSIRQLLSSFPGPDPAIPFSAARCVRTLLTGPRCHIDVPREAALPKPFLGRTSFWQILMEVAGGCPAHYAGYSYRDRGDRYQIALPAPVAARVRNAARLLRYSALREKIERAPFDGADLFQTR